MEIQSARPAKRLLGRNLQGWTVTEELPEKENASGGWHSVQYMVKNESTGEIAFLKAIDLFRRPNALRFMASGIANYEYEVDILNLCKDHSMDGIVRAIGNGIELITADGIDLPVPYLIFEPAEADVRTHELSRTFNLQWRLRVFHGVCVAARQLHQLRIAHQDLKPSNVLIFDKQKAKIADMGQSTKLDKPSNFEQDSHVGDRNYTPVELLYKNYGDGNWLQRRLGADFFMMGCLLVFLLTDSSLLTLMFERLDRRFWHDRWGGTYKEVIPHLRVALDEVLQEIKPTLPTAFSNELCTYICQLTNPDPLKRGHTHSWSGNQVIFNESETIEQIAEQYSLEKIISRFDYMVNHFEKENLPKKTFTKTRFLDFFTSAK